MPRTFTDIAFTAAVRSAQERYGSRQSYAALESRAPGHSSLGEVERAFIEARDGFYQASVSETGWPYVQFRGGPKGFLKVLDGSRIAYPDFRGNRQYISVGNLAANDRVALILMDYLNRRRLKIWARSEVHHLADQPELFEKLSLANYPAKVERALLFHVEAFDWNCPQHITPRFTKEEFLAFSQIGGL